MYIVQHALKNLTRNKGRNIMIGAILFAIILTTVVALIINHTASVVIDDYRGRFGSEVFLTPNMEKVQQEAMQNSTDGRVRIQLPQLSAEMYLQFADSSYLQKSILTGRIGANSSALEAIDQQDDTDDDSQNNEVVSQSGGQMTSMIRMDEGNFNLLGDSLQEFTDGVRAIESGTLPENDNECIISTDLAEQNDSSIGDLLAFTATVRVEAPEGMGAQELQDGDTVEVDGIQYDVSMTELDTILLSREVTYQLKVVGTYNDLTDEYENEQMPEAAWLNRRNEILTTLPTLLAVRNANENGIRISATYFLQSPDMLEDFEAEVRAKGLPDVFDVSTDAASYDSIVKPVLGLKSISITFMLVVMLLGGMILLLLVSISVRERKYEIGVLRAMGMKKSKVAFGLWTELLVITGICLVLGLGVGMTIAQPVSDTLLASQIETAESSNAQQPSNGMTVIGGPGGMVTSSSTTNAQPLSEMTIALDGITVVQIIAIAILLASLASLFSISKITKYEPIKILMERN